MSSKEFIDNLKFEYHSIQAANPEYKKSLWDFLRERKVKPNDIWTHCPDAGREAGKPEPKWM